MNWQKYWVTAVAGCALFAAVLDVDAVELQQCEWLSNQAYRQAWLRDAHIKFPQLKSMIGSSDERPEVQQGLIALGKYVYSHPEMSPDDLADDLLTSCRSYDQ